MESLVWHFGLIARWWAEFNTGGPEIDYFRSLIEQLGQPVLDAACGTGRLLLPYLRSGLDVDGCDISADMLGLCEAKAKQEGLNPVLYQQPLHELELPRLYQTIIVCGGFGLGTTRGQDQQALSRLFNQLQTGGWLLLDSYLPYRDADEWRYWLKDERSRLPEPWPSVRRRKRLSSGDELEIRTRVVALDVLGQAVTREIQAMLWRGEQLVRQEEHTLLERLYFRNELLDMLAGAGFRHVEVMADYTREPPTSESGILIYMAQK